MVISEGSRFLHWIRVRGQYACFSRPEFPRERISYSIITPSAAAGLFYSIFSKPAIQWRVRKIRLLAETKFIQFHRSELGYFPTFRKSEFVIQDHSTIRSTLVLKDVDYAIGAQLRLTDRVRAEDAGNYEKFSAMFHRRLEKGQMWSHPYLGLREFLADIEPYAGNPAAIRSHSYELGRMPLVVPFDQGPSNVPIFFEARVVSGEMDIPDWDASGREISQ